MRTVGEVWSAHPEARDPGSPGRRERFLPPECRGTVTNLFEFGTPTRGTHRPTGHRRAAAGVRWALCYSRRRARADRGRLWPPAAKAAADSGCERGSQCSRADRGCGLAARRALLTGSGAPPCSSRGAGVQWVPCKSLAARLADRGRGFPVSGLLPASDTLLAGCDACPWKPRGQGRGYSVGGAGH